MSRVWAYWGIRLRASKYPVTVTVYIFFWALVYIVYIFLQLQFISFISFYSYSYSLFLYSYSYSLYLFFWALVYIVFKPSHQLVRLQFTVSYDHKQVFLIPQTQRLVNPGVGQLWRWLESLIPKLDQGVKFSQDRVK